MAHGGRGKRIPGELWSEAAAVAQVEGVPHVARVLRLQPVRLEAIVADLSGGDEASFLELTLPAPTSQEAVRPTEAIVVQVTSAGDTQLRLELPAGTACDVLALLSAFMRHSR
ncbi:MAG: hypothetical protein GY772_24010 [bacterium]|nr:hypothetical protein [bacterium]